MPVLSRTAVKLVMLLVMIALCATFVTFRSCHRVTETAAQSRVAARQANAAIASGQDAVATLGAAHARESDIQNQVREGQDAIANAPAGNSNDIAVRAACRLRSYRHTPRCVALLGAAPD